MLHMHVTFPLAFFADILFLQGKHNGFSHTVHKVNFLIGSKF